MKWVQKNPAMVMIFAVAVVVIIALIVMIATRKKSDNDKNEEVSGSRKPEIEVLSMNKMLLPMDKTETYMIQEGYTIMELAKNVNFTLQWNNKGGIESIKTMIFKRFSPDNTLVTTETIQRNEDNPYFVPFTINNSYVFEGSAILSNTNLIGLNKLQILYVLEGETAEKVLFDSSVSFDDDQVKITDEDLKIIEITDIVQTITYTPTATSFSVLKASDDKNYYLYPGGGSSDVHSTLFEIQGPIKFLPAQDTGATTYDSSLFYIYFPEKRKYLGLSDADTRCHPSYSFRTEREPRVTGDYIAACFGDDGCSYPRILEDDWDRPQPSCIIDTSLPNPYIPPPQAAAATDRANAIKFKITNSTVADRYRFQSTNGLFLGMHSDTLVLVDINDQSISNTLYKTIDIQVSGGSGGTSSGGYGSPSQP